MFSKLLPGRRDVFLFRSYDLMHCRAENQIFDPSVTDRDEAVLSDRYVTREQPR